MTTAFRIHPDDNVATLLGDGSDVVTVIGDGEVALNEAIALGHKIALADIAAGAAVVKFGIPIGHAATAIRKGDWVHLHNCTSRFDERSGGFDVVTGAAKDMAYD
ncbi:SAF domain-containing protein [Sphingomonas sp. BT-65]|uniref:SAF domain-containing protein n=1 Tax=Sphingomonas sp. BT-65 TaxID=2989821 RepID=UPI0022362F42|nr:SAF domain-containing protein [Sphingomonas sp. BT-65]MCW4462734.1 SAF domain-containing protein [Sphingomonas sp. BT-65]